MPAVAARLSQAQFESEYSHRRPYFEYWLGEAVQKTMPNYLHGLLQFILMQILSEVGYKPAAEVRLKIDLELQLLPDVIATRGRVEVPYPTSAVEVAIEILSADDSLDRVIKKCELYERWGFSDIFVLDPEKRIAMEWRIGGLHATETFVAGIAVSEIWSRLDRMLL